MTSKKMERIYLDYASTTPLDPKVRKAMLPYLADHFYNTAALYREGVEVKKIIENGRRSVAQILRAHSDEIIFTGSGTEANNLAILGIFESSRKIMTRPHFVTSVIEHASILEVFREIERRGGEVSYVKVNEEGIVDL